MVFDLVNKLPYGLDTEIDEKGSYLEIRFKIGYQVLYENPSLVIFDESTNSLDATQKKNWR